MSVNLINFIQKEENLCKERALLGATRTHCPYDLWLPPLQDPPIQLFPSPKSRCSHCKPIQMCPCDLSPAVTTATTRSPRPAVIPISPSGCYPTTPIQVSSPSTGPPSPQGCSQLFPSPAPMQAVPVPMSPLSPPTLSLPLSWGYL